MKKKDFPEKEFGYLMKPIKMRLEDLGVGDKEICMAENMIRDLTELNESAGVKVIDMVESFLDQEIPEAADNSVVNAMLMAVMSILLKISDKDLDEIMRF